MNTLDNNIHSVLGQAGLSQSEQDVYLVGLEAGPSTSAQLIKKTGMPRPTVTAALRVLADNNLCDVRPIDGRSHSYTMLPPTNLKTVIGRRIRQLDEVMDSLDNLQVVNSQNPAVTEARGLDAVQDLLELALRCRSRHWQIISPYDNALRHMPVEYISYFKRIRTTRQIESQTLWEFGSDKMHVSLNDVLMRKPRYVPKEINETIPSLMLCFDDSLLTLNLDKAGNISATLLQNSGVAATFRIIFEMAWRSAR